VDEIEPIYLVTDDSWTREPGGRRDPTDEEIIREISQGGKYRVVVITAREMLRNFEESDSEKYKQFHDTMEKSAGVPLTYDQLLEFATKADDRLKEFTQLAQGMTLKQAAVVRKVRVDRRMTWRAVARTFHKLGWPNLRGWDPPSNQLMGMALCEKAAQFFQECYREPPWN
jgi:hypothetical protein